MKTFRIFILTVSLIAAYTVSGQGTNEIMIQFELPPAGQLYPEELYGSVILINTSGSPQYIALKAVVNESDQGLIFDGTSAVLEVPVGTYFVNEQDIEGGNVTYASAEIESFVLQTGTLPAGEYTICLYAEDAETGMLLGENCVEHLITNSSPPALMQPADGDVVQEPYPVFLWTPPVPMPSDNLPEYTFVMAEVSPGMSPQEAISQQPAWISLEGIQEPVFLYPPDAMELQQGVTYAWQVQSLLNGYPFGENGGFSEVFVFKYFSDGYGGIILLSPGEEENVVVENPVFQWEPMGGDDILYHFMLWEVNDEILALEQDGVALTGQMLMDYPVFYENDNLEDQGMVYPDLAPPLNPARGYYWYIEGQSSSGNTLHSEARRFSYRDETLKPCDTVEVNFRIRITIDSISSALCGLNDGLVDSLMNLYNQLEDEMWQRDSLKGAKDAADLFQQTMEGLKTSASGTFQDQIDETNNLSGTDAGCAGSWESDFYNRYVAPYPSPQREKVYNEYVKRYTRRFERCKSKRASWLEDDKDKIEKYYDNQLEDIEDIQKQIQGELGLHSRNIGDLQRRINALSQNLAAALCDIDVHWNAFIQYLDSNTVCIKCGKVYYTKPPDLQIMDSCLNNIYDKLRGKIRGLRSPDDMQELQAQANEYFPFDELMKEKDKLDSLKSAFQSTVNQWNQNSSLSKMVHPCCQSLMSLAGGRYLYGHQNKPFRNESSYGQRLGLGNAGVVAVPKNPQQMQNPDFRRQYYKDKRGFYKQRYELSKQIDKSIRNLKNGHSDGRSFMHGLKDDEAVRKHGMVKAHPYHKSSRDSIQDALEELLYKAGNCYDEDRQNQRHKEYLTLHHKCFNFRQCLEILDREYQYYRDSLGHYRNVLEDEISDAEKNLNRLKGKVERLRERINGLNQSIQNLQNQLAGVTDNSARTGIQNRINNLSNERNDIGRKLNLIENDIPAIERKLAGLRQRAEGLSAAMNPRPVASLTDCEAERQQVQQARHQQRNDAQGIHGDASNSSQEISRHLSEANGISDDITDAHRDGTTIGRDIENQLEEERQRAEAERLRKEREIKGICAKLLTEYCDENSPAGAVFDSLAVAYEFLSGQIDQIPGGLCAFTDKMKEFKDQIDEAKETIEDIVTILSGVNKEATLDERNKSFAKVLKYAAAFGDKVPGFGEMVSFYATAYQASINAIYEILEMQIAKIIPYIDYELRVVCPNESWKGKTLEQIENEMCNKSDILKRFDSLNPNQLEALEKYYKEKVKESILECCLKKLGE